MTISAEKIADLRVKHLEMLQSLITRMAGYGASFKPYCITVATTVIGFGFTLHRPLVSALAILPILALAEGVIRHQLCSTSDSILFSKRVARMSGATSGIILTPPRISLRSSGLRLLFGRRRA